MKWGLKFRGRRAWKFSASPELFFIIYDQSLTWKFTILKSEQGGGGLKLDNSSKGTIWMTPRRVQLPCSSSNCALVSTKVVYSTHFIFDKFLCCTYFLTYSSFLGQFSLFHWLVPSLLKHILYIIITSFRRAKVKLCYVHFWPKNFYSCFVLVFLRGILP